MNIVLHVSVRCSHWEIPIRVEPYVVYTILSGDWVSIGSNGISLASIGPILVMFYWD